MSLAAALQMYAGFVRKLPGFLAGQVDPGQARAAILDGLARREQRLLDLVRLGIYSNPGSPYLPLLRRAGCAYADLERMVRVEGVEGALATLADEGVRVSHEELTRRAPMVGEGGSATVPEGAFDNPSAIRHVTARTGGSRSAGRRTAYDLGFLDDCWSVHMAVAFEALGVYGVPYGLWLPIMPGAGPIVLLTHTRTGMVPTRWFSPFSAGEIRSSVKDRLGTHGLVAAGRFLGKRWPWPERVPLEDAEKVARWIHRALESQGRCCFNAYTGTALRVCQAARRAGLDLSGAVFLFGGEPLTEAKRAELTRAGVTSFLMYGTMDAGFLGAGCLNPAAADDVHLLTDAFAFVQRPRYVTHAETSVDALLVTSLLPTTPRILLNVETGDYGVVERRSCGCPWHELGLTTHLHSIRAFDKLTCEGMTFVGTDLLEVFEQVLPRRFGGASIDYQLIEEEDQDGRTRLSIVVDPGVPDLDEEELVRTLLAALADGPTHNRMMARMWAESGTLRVVRRRPRLTSGGKLLPLHIQRD